MTSSGAFVVIMLGSSFRACGNYPKNGGKSKREKPRKGGGLFSGFSSFIEKRFILVAGGVCSLFLIVFFSVALSTSNTFGGYVKPYFHNPIGEDGLLRTQFGVDTRWKFFLLFLSMTAFNALSFWISTKFVVWRWKNIFDPKGDADKETGWELRLVGLCLATIPIELFVTTVNLVNLLVSFSSVYMLSTIALAHAVIVFHLGYTHRKTVL